METKYDCAGFCEPPGVYLTRPIADGPPKQGCFSAFIEDVPSQMNMIATVGIITGIWMLLAMCCACSICCGADDENEVKPTNN